MNNDRRELRPAFPLESRLVDDTLVIYNRERPNEWIKGPGIEAAR